MKFDRDNLLLYAVTDRAWVGRQTLLEQIESALAGGVTLVQLREKRMSGEDLVREAREVRALCHRYGVPLILNDDVDAALASGADGVHVGAEDLPVRSVRERVGQGMIVGATAKTVAQAQAAEAAGADYLGVGAVFPSPTKQNAIRITAEELRRQETGREDERRRGYGLDQKGRTLRSGSTGIDSHIGEHDRNGNKRRDRNAGRQWV